MESRYTLRVERDENAENPRREWDHEGTVLLAWHRRYDLGDRVSSEIRPDNYDGRDEHLAAIRERFAPVAMLPVYGYEHGGITISTGAYGCRWDSGQIGWILATPNPRWESKSSEEIEAALRAEVALVDAWLTGDVWGWEVIDAEDGGPCESCWGYYADEQGAEADGRATLAHWRQREAEEQAQAQAKAAAEAARIVRLERIAEAARALLDAACPEGTERRGTWADLAAALDED